MADLSNVKKGDTIFVANRDLRVHHHREFEAVVLSAGSKWITVANAQRFSRDGHGEYGYSAWPSRKAYEDEQIVLTAWDDLRAFVCRHGGAPKTISAQDIQDALRILTGEKATKAPAQDGAERCDLADDCPPQCEYCDGSGMISWIDRCVDCNPPEEAPVQNTMSVERGSDTCPACGAYEVPCMDPRTVYACGSRDYDGRPGTFERGADCNGTGKARQ